MTNVALVVLDTLRKDAFDRHFGWLGGRRFEQAFSPSHWTVPAHAALFTGAYPSEVGVHAKHLYLDRAEPVLAERLAEAGYTTRALSANPNVSGHFEFDRGFDAFESPPTTAHLTDDDVYDWRKLNREAEGPLDYLRGVRDCLLGEWETLSSLTALLTLLHQSRSGGLFGGIDSAEWALSAIRRTEFSRREFLFVNLMEVHQPYEIPPAYRTVEPPELVPVVGDLALGALDGERTRRAYDDAARYLSDVYRSIVSELEDSFDVVITTSDHGEMLGEGGCWGHEHGIDPPLTRVPLVVRGAGPSGPCDLPVGLTDLYGTVLSAAGLEPGADGQDLTERVRPRDYRTEFHGLTPWSRRRLEAAGYPREEIERYDRELLGIVTTDYYGYEGKEGLSETGTRSGEVDLRRRLQTIRRELDAPTAARTDIPEDVRDQLERLGYR